ncbi:uncharacterized protein LOC130693116 [Daphnia carinata]|uniref:uncharacterized protein LOC130693116 n=1 Tax=Daphnia carinata TaxID=120202 RepID=UPI00286885BE|nr:uncharacterized protein LOC130693116 [Daphnia carinata]
MDRGERSNGPLDALTSLSCHHYETPEDVFQDILSWIQDANTDPKLAENAVSHISEKVGRILKPLETSCVESQYVKALLTTWVKNSLNMAFSYLEDETTDISKEMSTILDELDSVNSIKDIETKLITEKSKLWTWCVKGKGCWYFQLILVQEELLKNTPCFVTLLNRYFNKLKSFIINKIFARCRDDVINGGLNGSEVQKFFSALTDFLTNVNEDPDSHDVLKDYMLGSIPTTSDHETDRQEWINELVEKISKIFLPKTSDNEKEVIPEWTQRFKLATLLVTPQTFPKLKLLIREICKYFLLPKTTIEVRKQYGREIILINGVAVFVSKMLEIMKEMKANHKKVKEIQIVGQSSIHIDCDLQNEIWHGFNVGIVTDKLIVCAAQKDKNRMWDVSGRHASTVGSRGTCLKAGESGGNVRIKCNEIIGAERWTIECNGGDGGSARKWSVEEFKKVFSPILPLVEEAKNKKADKQISDQPAIKDLYEKLEDTLLDDFEFVGVRIGQVQDERQARSGRLGDGSEITFSLYESKKTKNLHTVILCKGAGVGKGGYGGDVILELSNKERGLPLAGMEMYQAMDIGGVVYKASGSDGRTGQASGDAGFIYNGDQNQSGNFIGFENYQTLEIRYYSKKDELKKDKVISYARAYGCSENQRYATIVSTFGQQKGSSVSPREATKKNAVIRQSLVHHFTKINVRKQMNESLCKTFLFDPLEENQSLNIDQLMEEIQSNEAHFDDLVYLQFNQEKVRCTKPVPVVKSSATCAPSVSPKIASNVRTLSEDNKENRRMLERFLKDNLENFKPDTWKQLSEQLKLESKKKIEKLDERLVYIFSYLNHERNSRQKENIGKKWNKKININETEDGLKSLAVFLYDFECAVQQLRKPTDDNFRLRDNQILAVLMLLPKPKMSFDVTKQPFYRSLAQVSTGEGKSLIVAAVAIVHVRHGFSSKKPIDVITSNDLLALRDSNLLVAEGGLKDLYEYFDVSVANNSSQSEDIRKASYSAEVVYGQLANFQRDYLLDKFYDRNIRSDREFTYAIIDEVDCMLLDRGNNTLYLSHDIPGMETLESLYVFIWEKICNSTIDRNNSKEQVKKSIKCDVLFDLYGVTTKDDLKSVHAPLDDSEKDVLWNHLIEKEVIDSQGRLLIENANKMTREVIYTPMQLQRKNLDEKLIFYFSRVANRQRRIRIPVHLLDFVDRHLSTWLESAFQALDLRPDEDYVIDQDRTHTNPDLNPQVIIIDPDTGTDQTSSQWDGALHQFIQLKEGCKLTLQSLKAIFISNAMYILKYFGLVGVSGTLGSEEEMFFLQDTIKSELFPIPRAFVNRFKKEDAQVLTTKEEWLNAISLETKTIIEKGRSIIIFCKSIKDVNLIHQRLTHSILELNGNSCLHRYTRDYVKFAFQRTELDIGHVIVATNLAGRGTDIKISKQLSVNGGLHVCLSYFPENERIEEQAMGRAARNGAPGSGILIICKSISCNGMARDGKDIRNLTEIMKNERDIREKERIARLEEDFKLMGDQAKLFDQFSKYYTDLKKKRKKYGDQLVSAICGSVLDQWALWLNEMNSCPLDVKIHSYLTKFLLKFKALDQDNFDISQIGWMTPARSVVVAKHLATSNKKPNLSAATELLEQLIQSKDNQFYPAAYYYRAFLLLKDSYEVNKNEFIKTLRTCENVLSEHINMQISFFSIVQTTIRKTDQLLSFRVIYGYTQQKENMVNLFQYFVGSVRSLLGTDCSIEDFEAAGHLPKKIEEFFEKHLKNFEKWIQREVHGNFKVFQKKDKNNKESKNFTIPPEKVEEYFKLLLEGESKCIGNQLNDANTIPSWNSPIGKNAKSNREWSIERVAKAYGVSAFTLEKSLNQAITKELNKEDIEKEIENETKKKFEEDNLIPCTRDSFWARLVEFGALFNNQNFVAMDECNVDKYNLKREEAKTFPFDDKDYVLYNPINDNSKNGQEKKIIFSQKYVEETLYGNRMKSFRRDQFQVNKIAKVDVEKLKSVDLKLFGQLTYDDLREANISPTERQGIIDELKKQDIIDDDGNLSPNYNGQKFEYSNCPAYEDSVVRLLGSKLRAEIVRRHWLNCKDNSNRLEAINLLPLTPYRDILDDLIAAYVVSYGVRVKGMDERILETKVNEITKKDHERECILDFLRSRQAIYEASWMANQKAALDFIDSDIRNVKGNTFESELCLLHLIGFDHVIYMKDRHMSTKQVVLSSLITPFIIIGGVASISAGAVLTIFSKLLPFRFGKDLLFMGGLSDIIYIFTAALSNDRISFSGYARQKIRSSIGKSNIADQVKTLWTLSKPGKLGGNNFRPAVLIHMDTFHGRRGKNREADRQKIFNALLQLKK